MQPTPDPGFASKRIQYTPRPYLEFGLLSVVYLAVHALLQPLAALAQIVKTKVPGVNGTFVVSGDTPSAPWYILTPGQSDLIISAYVTGIPRSGEVHRAKHPPG